MHRVNLEVVEDSAFYRFEVEVPYKDGIAFRPHERVSLALKGMIVTQRKESSAPHYFPIVLRFPDGVVLKYLSGANTGKVVNTWEGVYIQCETRRMLMSLGAHRKHGRMVQPKRSSHFLECNRRVRDSSWSPPGNNLSTSADLPT